MHTSSRREFLAVSLSAAAVRLATADTSAGLTSLTLKQASERIRAKTVSPRELTQACLDRIQTYNPKIGAWITVMRDKALAQAKTLEDEQAAGHIRGPLHGIPIGIKDSIDVTGARTTAASAVYEHRFPSEDAEVVRRLKAAGAVVIGKLNMHEFDAGATSAVSYWGPVRNPLEFGARFGRPIGRLGRGRGHRELLRGAGHRHQRRHSHSGGVLRRGRVETHLWPGEPARHCAHGLVARSLRPYRPDGGRCGHRSRRDRGLRSSRYRQRRPAGSRLHRRHRRAGL
jgi:hypothetical protein